MAEILKPRWLSRVVSVALSGQEPAELRLSYRTNAKARAALEEEIFGKRALFSDKGPELASTARWSCRLPLPGGGRGRLPPDERPQGRVFLAHVPLDRPEDPRPCLLLRARLDGRPLDDPSRPTGPAFT